MSMTPWQLFIDLGLAAVLLLIASLLRAKVRPVQRMFLPASVVAGLLGLAVGPNGAGWLPLSDAFGSYPGILIGLVFAALPFVSGEAPLSALTGRLARLWAFSSVAILLQWGVGIAVAALLLRQMWPELNPGFGALIAVGFVGGHGTAAAVGQVLADLGWPQASSLAMTSATVGILSAVVGGMLWVRWGAATGQARYVTRFQDLPPELRTGLVSADRRQPTGTETVSASAIDGLVLHFSLIAAAGLAGYYASHWAATWFDAFRLPVFCLAFVAGSLLRLGLRATGAIDYVDRKTMGHLCGSLTDLLVVFGIASIRIPVLIEYALPLSILLLAGIAVCGALFRCLGPRFFAEHWFERSLFTWGWITGITALGIALLRVVDPRNESESLADFGVAYLFLAPIEVGLLAIAPQVLMQGPGWWLVAVTLVGALALGVGFGRRHQGGVDG